MGKKNFYLLSILAFLAFQTISANDPYGIEEEEEEEEIKMRKRVQSLLADSLDSSINNFNEKHESFIQNNRKELKNLLKYLLSLLKEYALSEKLGVNHIEGNLIDCSKDFSDNWTPVIRDCNSIILLAFAAANKTYYKNEEFQKLAQFNKAISAIKYLIRTITFQPLS